MIAFDYPILAHEMELAGSLEFLLRIDGDGSVSSVLLVSGNIQLDEGISRTLKRWRFTPCRGSIADCTFPISANFILEGGPKKLTDCKTRFEFDAPGRITVKSERVDAITVY